jgi:hypothetical protein
MSFPDKPHKLLTPVRTSALKLPLADHQSPAVICMDVMEHIPAEHRRAVADELVRVTAGLLVIGFPSGAPATRQDAELADRYEQRHGQPYHYLLEHVANGLPDVAEVRTWLDEACHVRGRSYSIEVVDNGSLWLRRRIMNRWVEDRPLDRALIVLAVWAHPLLSRAHRGTCYRKLIVVQFADDLQDTQPE